MTWALRYVPEPEFRLPAFTWDRDRKACESCKHMSMHDATSMRCGMSQRGFGENCITLRGAGGACGPEARLFEAA